MCKTYTKPLEIIHNLEHIETKRRNQTSPSSTPPLSTIYIEQNFEDDVILQNRSHDFTCKTYPKTLETLHNLKHIDHTPNSSFFHPQGSSTPICILKNWIASSMIPSSQRNTSSALIGRESRTRDRESQLSRLLKSLLDYGRSYKSRIGLLAGWMLSRASGSTHRHFAHTALEYSSPGVPRPLDVAQGGFVLYKDSGRAQSICCPLSTPFTSLRHLSRYARPRER